MLHQLTVFSLHQLTVISHSLAHDTIPDDEIKPNVIASFNYVEGFHSKDPETASETGNSVRKQTRRACVLAEGRAAAVNVF